VVAVVVVLLATSCHSDASTGAAPQTRAYFIAADEVAWNYAPANMNMITGQPFDETANKYVQGCRGFWNGIRRWRAFPQFIALFGLDEWGVNCLHSSGR
jgi:hypothetical protein